MIKILKSVNGGNFSEVTITQEEFDALYDYSCGIDTHVFLMKKKLLSDELNDSLSVIVANAGILLKNFNYSKKDISAHYLFESVTK